MPRLLKESEAWREIAQEVERRGLLRSGLCYEVNTLLWVGEIGVRMADRMKGRIYDHLDAQASEYGYAPTCMDATGYDPPRILAALFLSYEAADEGK